MIGQGFADDCRTHVRVETDRIRVRNPFHSRAAIGAGLGGGMDKEAATHADPDGIRRQPEVVKQRNIALHHERIPADDALAAYGLVCVVLKQVCGADVQPLGPRINPFGGIAPVCFGGHRQRM